MVTQIGKADFYNEIYKREDYFRYPTWIYAPYVSSLIAFCGLKKGDSILDVGCGQGFFSYLFSKHGLRVQGIDISETGIRTAEKSYAQLGIAFSVADIRTATFPEQFDCIFVRSCSLYNTHAFPHQKEVTRDLLRHMKSGGTFIFAYNSNFSSKESLTWRYHSLWDMEEHFSPYSNAQIFFLNKIMTFLLGRHSFSLLFTRFNILLSEVSGVGGELICVLKNQ
jgi:SAM-dependent methyltransferase